MSPRATPHIEDFDFGLSGPLTLPDEEPSPEMWLEYTAWHIRRALEFHRQDVNAGRHNISVWPVLEAFKDLKVVRWIQPFRCVKDGEVTHVEIREPVKAREQAAILLYALLPGKQEERCSSCAKHDGTGPFAKCVSRGDRWTGDACLNCYYTGVMHKCDLRKKRDSIHQQELEERCDLFRVLPEGIEGTASTLEIETWLSLIRKEQGRRQANSV